MADFVATAGFDAVELIESSELVLGRRPGESVAVGSGKPANKHAQKLLNNIQALRDGKLQGPSNCVLYGATSVSGYDPDFATFSSNVLTIAGNVTPLILNFANGYSDFGTKQTLVKFTGTLTIDYTAVTAQHLVFAVWDGSALSLVSLALGNTNPRYHATMVKPAFDGADQFWFDPTRNAMYRDIGGAGTWVQVQAIFLGGADVGASDNWYGKHYGVPAFDFQNPVGEIRIWHDTTLPRGFVLCDGSGVKVSRFPDLYNAMGEIYASTTPPLDEFDLPDLTPESLGPGPITVLYMMKAY